MAEYKEVRLGIRKVRTLAFQTNESLFRPNSDEEYNIDFNHQLKSDIEKELIIFNLTVTFYYKDTTKEFTLFEIQTENVFQIINLREYTVKGEDGNTLYDLDENAWAAIVGLSISNTRGLSSPIIASTVYKDVIIPIVNPLEITRIFFPVAIPINQTQTDQKAST